jgi:hypothetical protein
MILIAEYRINATHISRKLGKKMKTIFEGELFYDSKHLKIIWNKSTHYTGVEVHLIDDIEEAIKELKTLFYKAKLPFKFQEDYLLSIRPKNTRMIKTIQDNGFVFNYSEKVWEWHGI